MYTFLVDLGCTKISTSMTDPCKLREASFREEFLKMASVNGRGRDSFARRIQLGLSIPFTFDFVRHRRIEMIDAARIGRIGCHRAIFERKNIAVSQRNGSLIRISLGNL